MNPFRIDGKLAMVTGASRGIGLGAAEALARSGARLMLVGRNEEELERSAEALRVHTEAVHVLPFDLMQSDAIRPWMEKRFDELGTPDILVNSAGMQRRGPAVDLSLQDFNDVMTLNATAIFEVSRTFARRRKALGGGGKVINIASLMTAAARPGTSPYTASKGAVGQLTKVLAIEWAKDHIFVNAIAPGYIDTDLNKSLIADPAFDSWVKGRCPLGRWGTPMDIAWPIVFLASSASDFITGQVIYVDGGWLATF
ncbi:5-keto-D-gluconate 5-reductase [Acidisarcina polymorpha]|uniref:5-keto-D-gluconate 5-reductase n=1 Tax=Acidisarcina polymorpha TaxID=2211140 RepID=A0A2Z5G297_9BACT|nr:SDR family oxidoreductase [Acidisarcina polymorpha]AXC13313.1 5-keto-D-gluconate 5-reductase [Acidisarcina polymorpha]